MKLFVEILLLTIIIVILIYLSFYYAKILLAPNSGPSSSSLVCFGNNCFQAELAVTETQREKGLMNRDKLESDKGMLFIFEKEGIYSFWMKNTLIPLDMIWLNSNKEIVFIATDVQPCKTLICPSTVPQAKAKYVLEINAGIVQKIGLKVGDIMEIK